MSHINLLDYLDPTMEDELELDSVEPLSCENSDLMSSDFFDSVYSMVSDSFNEGAVDLDQDFLTTSDNGHLSDGLQSPASVSSDSGSCEAIDSVKDCFVLDNNNLEDVSDLMNLPVDLTETQQYNKIKKIQEPVPKKVFLNYPKAKKVIISKPTFNTNTLKNAPNAKQVLRVQSISGNKRPLLLPFNVANLKSIKIVRGNKLQAENIKFTNVNDVNVKRQARIVKEYISSSPESTEQDDSDHCDSKSEGNGRYPPLVLNEEERRLLAKEGIQLPTRYPLTKNEERDLKRIRRKIRNKISAQDSRKRKKEYVDGLEERIKRGVVEKKLLMNHMKQLQKENGRLVAHIKKLQNVIFNSASSKTAPSTCLMIILFSVMLVSFPNLRLSKNTELSNQEQTAVRRALLFSEQATNDEDFNMDELLLFNKDDDAEFPAFLDEDNKTTEQIVEEFGLKYEDFSDETKEVLESFKNMFQEEFKQFNKNDLSYGKTAYDGEKHKHEFHEPDIDDFLPQRGLKRQADRVEEGNERKMKVVPVVTRPTFPTLKSKKE